MKLGIVLIGFLMGLIVTSCDRTQTADDKMAEVTQNIMLEAQKQIGMPAIVNFQERKLAKQIFELRDQENLICYAYITSYLGDLIFIGKCIGYGLPYSIQYTNPKKLRWKHNHGYYQMPQADPNGLFMPEGLSATWVMLIDTVTNKGRPVYIEQEIIISPFPLTNKGK